MEGEEATAELETAIEQEAPEQPVDLEAQRDEEANPPAEGEEQQPEPDDSEEFEWQGKQVRGPKGLKDGVLMHADYTRKTQEVAERRKELETREQAIIQQSKAHEEQAELYGKLYSYKTQLEPYAKLTQADWDQWSTDDPIAANDGWRRYQQLQQDAQKAYWEVNQRQQERTKQEQQATAKRLTETREFAEKNIPGWSPEVDAKVTEFAVKEMGFDVDTLKAAYNPPVYRTLYLAWLGHQTMQKANAPVAKAPPPKPLEVVAAKAAPPARKDLKSMSMEEYMAFRDKQDAARRR